LQRPGAGTEEQEPSVHAHRIAGHAVPSFDPPWSDRVRGLGVSDALQLQLEPGQLPWLLDELDELSVAHEQGLSEAAGHRALVADRQCHGDATEVVERHRGELAVLRAVRERITPALDGRAIVCGPAPLVSSLVRSVTRTVAARLVELAGELPAEPDAEASRRLVSAAAATLDWVQTLVALEQLEWFDFDGEPVTHTTDQAG
jgi:hypothetical protein